jgi:large subunit ribosomal protein L21e
MSIKKNIREKGKLSLSKYFKKFEEGESVAVVLEKSLKAEIPSRFQGRTGTIIGKRGRAYIVKIKDQNKPKEFLIKPIHLKKLN